MQFDYAFKGEFKNIVDFFSDETRDVNQLDSNERTVLHWACSGKHYDIVEYLIKTKNANVLLLDDNGWSPLTIATSCGCDDIVDILIKNGADINVKNRNGCTPLHYSSSKNYVYITKYLLENGAKVNEHEFITRETPLHRASARGNHQVMNLLLEHNAYIDSKNKQNETPLILAILNNDMGAVDLLLSFGAMPNEIDPITNKCALDYANPKMAKSIKELI